MAIKDLGGDLAAKSPYWFSLWRGLRAGLLARGDALAVQDDDAGSIALHQRTLLEDDVAEAKAAAHLEEVRAEREPGQVSVGTPARARSVGDALQRHALARLDDPFCGGEIELVDRGDEHFARRRVDVDQRSEIAACRG